MSFSKRSGKNTSRCYTKPLDSLKNWNNRFFWVDEKVFPTVVVWPTEMDLFNLISAPNPTKVKTGTRPRAAHDVPLLTATASRVIEMEDPVAMSTSSKTPSVAPAVASQEVPSAENTATTEVVPELNMEKETTAKEPPINKRRHDTHGGKSLAVIGLGPEPPSHTTVQQSVSNTDPLSHAKPQPITEQDVAQVTRSILQPDSVGRNKGRLPLDSPGACQDLVHHIAPPRYFSELRHLPNDDFLSQYNINLARQVAMGSQLWLRFEQEAKLLKKYVAQVACRAKNAKIVKELESLRAQFTDLQVSNDRLSQQVSTLQAQVTSKERIKAAFEEFKKYEDDKVEQRCAEMDARLDKLSVDFDDELVKAGICMLLCPLGTTKGWSEGLRYGIEHGKAGRDLVDVEAYDPEANSKLVKALQDLKDLNDTGGMYASRGIRDLRLSSSGNYNDLLLYPEVRDPKDPWAVKEEMILEDAITANKRHAEKKKKCRVVCRTYGIGSAHHPRSDGIHVSAPTVVPQGLAIFVADAATQTEAANKEEEPHQRPQRSMSLPPAYHL
ncbi:hypothetical protein Tco_0448522 [Tanacetum coccineum]